jgi:hypothetical protein
MRSATLLGATLALTALAVAPATADAQRSTLRVIPKSEWISALGPFSRATVRINNYSPTAIRGQPPASAFHLANSSRLGLPNGVSVPFNIPVIRQDPYSIYVNDLNSRGINIDARSGAAFVSIRFEDEGYEIIGNCVENLVCICGDPRIHLNDAELLTRLRIGVNAGSLVIREITSEFRSSFDESGPCRDNVCAFACDIFAPNRESRTRDAIQHAADRFFDSNRGLVESLLNARLRDLGVTQPVTSALIGNRGELILTLGSR